MALKGSPDSFLSYRVSRRENPEALAGFHSQNMLAVCDEASGIPDIIFETASGSLSTPNAKIVLAGNPTRSSGFFTNAFTQCVIVGIYKQFHQGWRLCK